MTDSEEISRIRETTEKTRSELVEVRERIVRTEVGMVTIGDDLKTIKSNLTWLALTVISAIVGGGITIAVGLITRGLTGS